MSGIEEKFMKSIDEATKLMEEEMKLEEIRDKLEDKIWKLEETKRQCNSPSIVKELKAAYLLLQKVDMHLAALQKKFKSLDKEQLAMDAEIARLNKEIEEEFNKFDKIIDNITIELKASTKRK